MQGTIHRDLKTGHFYAVVTVNGINHRFGYSPYREDVLEALEDAQEGDFKAPTFNTDQVNRKELKLPICKGAGRYAARTIKDTTSKPKEAAARPDNGNKSYITKQERAQRMREIDLLFGLCDDVPF